MKRGQISVCILITHLPKVIVHRLEEELVVGFVEYPFEVCQGHPLGGHRQLDQIGRLLLIQVVDNLGLPHGDPAGVRGTRRGRSLLYPGVGRGPAPVVVIHGRPWKEKGDRLWPGDTLTL